MGGRGGSSRLNPYIGLSADYLNQRIEQAESTIKSKHVTASLINSKNATVRRKAQAARKAIEAEQAKVDLMKKALKHAPKNLPF